MFTSGQIVFTILFVIVFAVYIVLAYKKDKKLHQKNYKGAQWVGLFFIILPAILFVIKHFIK